MITPTFSHPPIVQRGEPRFSLGGHRAACLAHDDTGTQFIEVWQSTLDGPALVTRTEAVLEPRMTQLAIRNDGHALVTWNEAAGQYFDVSTPQGERSRLGFSQIPLRVIGAPDMQGWLGVAVPNVADRESVLHRIADRDSWYEPIARVPGRVGGMRSTAGGIAVTSLVGGRAIPMLVNAVSGSVAPLLDVEPEHGAHVLLVGGGQILLGVPSDNGFRLGLAAERGGPIRLLDPVPDLGGTVTPVALDPSGTRLAFLVNHGPRTELKVLDVESGAIQPVPAPVGVLSRNAAWTRDTLWLIMSTSTQPATFAWRGADHVDLRTRPARAWQWPAESMTFAGPSGPIEALACGPDWRTSPRVVVLLHGGPDAHWTLGFERFWQLLADAGIAVVAPNQRGSTGYGAAHAGAIVGAWGGPDLDDIRALGRYLVENRPSGAPAPAVCGMSYGAFLALLAVAVDQYLWSKCVAVAPFRSVPVLYAEATVAVRNLIDRLDGQGQVNDEFGPRDLDRLVERIRTPVTLVHGACDETIPVEHSRHLAQRLRDLGGCRVRYVELAARGHGGIGQYTGEQYAKHILDELGEVWVAIH